MPNKINNVVCQDMWMAKGGGIMKEGSPWNDSWQDQIVYISVPHQVEPPVEMAPDFSYPIFVGAFEQKLSGQDFWKAIAGAMVFVLGHRPDDSKASHYVHWLNTYNSSLAGELIYDGANQATKGNLETAIWILQAAVLLDPGIAETHYNLGLAFNQLGMALLEKGKKAQGELSLKQAIQYMENALELDPKLSLACYNLGYIYKRMGMMDESQKYLEKCVLLEMDKMTRHEGEKETDIP